MQLEHTFSVPTGVDEAFAVLRDIERIARCLPGATIDSVDGDEFTGTVKVKVGPIQVSYKGEARFINIDEGAHTATLQANGSQLRGAGTARATVRAALTPGDDGTEVRVVTDLAITGKPAQFGRGVMVDVGERLLGQFAGCLAEELTAPAAPTSAAEPEPAVAASAEAAMATAPAMTRDDGAHEVPTSAASHPPVVVRRTNDAIDLFDVAGAPLARRLAPVAAAAALAALAWWLRRRPAGVS